MRRKSSKTASATNVGARASQPRQRCAIYTRKSSEEGLDQEFNSLDAQYEACAAFIASQAGLGWKLVPDRYDDGGISGGTMERPALQRLLQDIRDRKIDVVVVYKIDRLTRSLMDFARIVEIFDASGVSFVSVTLTITASAIDTMSPGASDTIRRTRKEAGASPPTSLKGSCCSKPTPSCEIDR